MFKTVLPVPQLSCLPSLDRLASLGENQTLKQVRMESELAFSAACSWQPEKKGLLESETMLAGLACWLSAFSKRTETWSRHINVVVSNCII